MDKVTLQLLNLTPEQLERYTILQKLRNMTPEQLKRWRLMQRVGRFYAKKEREQIEQDVKSGRLINRKDAEKEQERSVVFVFNTYANNSNCKTRKRINGQSLATLATLAEIAYSGWDKELTRFAKTAQPFFKEELNKAIESSINIKLDGDKSEYTEQIINFLSDFLGTTEHIIRRVSGEINNSCEFKKVMIFIVVCGSVAELPKRDRKKIYEEKKKFERRKKSLVEGLKEFNASYDEVESKEFISSSDLGWDNYETTLKHYKKILSLALIKDCNTGKKRAEEIAKILDYL